MSRAGQYEVRGVALLPVAWEGLNMAAARRTMENPTRTVSASAIIREAIEAHLQKLARGGK